MSSEMDYVWLKIRSLSQIIKIPRHVTQGVLIQIPAVCCFTTVGLMIQ